jgi:hypothetical protein
MTASSSSGKKFAHNVDAPDEVAEGGQTRHLENFYQGLKKILGVEGGHLPPLDPPSLRP